MFNKVLGELQLAQILQTQIKELVALLLDIEPVQVHRATLAPQLDSKQVTLSKATKVSPSVLTRECNNKILKQSLSVTFLEKIHRDLKPSLLATQLAITVKEINALPSVPVLEIAGKK
jgi:hypothetical protein